MESSNFSCKEICKVERDSENPTENFYQEDSIDFEDIKIEPGRNSTPDSPELIEVEVENLNPKAENSPAADSRNEVQTSAVRNSEDNEGFAIIFIKEEIIEETPEIAKPYNCPICSSRFPAKRNLIRHLRIHAAKKSYSCSTCSAVFGSHSNLSQHRLIHAEEKPHACKFCPSRFTQKGNLDRHMLIHSGVKPFACEICAAEFRQKSHLLSHIKMYHEGKEICLRQEKADKRVNQEGKFHTCEICSSEFAMKSRLKVHMVSHMGRSPFSCNVCCAKFASRGDLKKHMLVHTKHKPFYYQCQTCLKTYDFANLLEEHMKLHTGGK